MKKTAFVTGATSGFGEAIARRLSQEGYKIVALARREDRLKKLASELGDTHIIVADIRDKKAVFLTQLIACLINLKISKCL